MTLFPLILRSLSEVTLLPAMLTLPPFRWVVPPETSEPATVWVLSVSTSWVIPKPKRQSTEASSKAIALGSSFLEVSALGSATYSAVVIGVATVRAATLVSATLDSATLASAPLAATA